MRMKRKHSVNSVFFLFSFPATFASKKLCGILKRLNQFIPVMKVAV